MLSILYCTFINLLYSYVGWKRKQASRGSALNLERTVQLPFLSLEGEESSEGVTGGKSPANTIPAKDMHLHTGTKLPIETFIKALSFKPHVGHF